MDKTTLAARLAGRFALGAVRAAETRHFQDPEVQRDLRRKSRKRAEECTPCAAMDYVDRTFSSLGDI